MQKLLFSLALFVAFFAACDKTDPIETVDFSAQLETSEAVISTTYLDLDAKAAALVAALETLETAQNQSNLDAARQAWRVARRPWEQSEGFLFGPVDQLGIDPAMDSWPVNAADLDAILASQNALTKAFLDTQEGTVKGFHTLEYLLFGQNSTKTAADFTLREFEYLRACGQSLKGETAKLTANWATFAKNLQKAGTSESIYPSQKAAVQELVNGMTGICDEVGNGKIQDPFSQQNVLLEESRFSNNSKADFTDNIRSIRNIYFGSTDGTRKATSLAAMILAKNAGLDAKVDAQILTATSAIESIPGTFTTAIFDQKPAVENAQKQVRDLQDLLQNDLTSFVAGL